MDLFKCFFFFFLLSSKFFSQLGTPKYDVDWIKDSISIYYGFNGAKGVAADPDGNAIIVGDYNYSYSHSTLSYGGAFITKYASNGEVLWSDTMRATAVTSVVGVVSDKKGSIYVLINSPRRITIGGTDYTGVLSVFLAKYNSHGKVEWVKLVSYSSGEGISIDSNDNIYISVNGPDSFPENKTTGISKYSTDGELVFFIHLDCGNYEICADGDGNLYSFQTIFYGTFKDYLVKYDLIGNELWRKEMPRGKIVADKLGRCYYAYSAEYDTTTILSRINTDATLLWTDTLSFGTSALYADNFGSVYAAGGSYYKMVFGKYDEQGENLWTYSILSSAAFNRYIPTGISVANNSVFECGEVKLSETSQGFLIKLKEYGLTNLKKEDNVGRAVIAPNPSNGEFLILFIDTADTIVSIIILDMIGTPVYDKEYGSNSSQFNERISLRNMPNGIYSVIMKTNRGTIVKKISVDK